MKDWRKQLSDFKKVMQGKQPERKPMPEPQALARIIRNGWKQLALSDREDPEALAELLKEILTDLEAVEAAT